MTDVRATRSNRAIVTRATAFLVLLALAACTDETGLHAPDPAGPASPLDGAHPPLAALACSADVGERTLTCEPPSSSPDADGPDDVAGLIVGGQGTYVQLESGDVSYDSSSEIFAADVTVTNLIPQAIGTADGETVDPDGVRVFFESAPAPTGGSGTVTVANADGSATFTSGTQDYFEYGDLLEPEATSSEREWRWNVPSGVTGFDFTVYVSAAVPNPDGFVDAPGEAVVLGVGDAADLDATARDVVGRPDAGRTLTWSDVGSAGVVTVDDAATGEISADAAGVDTLEVSSDGPETTATVVVRVIPDVIYVDAAATGADDGSSWDDAYTSASDAIAAAGAGDEIWVAEGTYTITSTAEIAADSIGLYGGFAGGELSRDGRDPSTRETAFTADQALDFTMLEVPSGVDGIRIDGLTLRDAFDGALSVHGEVIVTRCAFLENVESNTGAGIHVTDGRATVLNSVFRGNLGAAISINGNAARLDVANVSFAGNQHTGSQAGGAIRVTGPNTVSIVNSTFAGNVSDAGQTGGGGAIFLTATQPTMVVTIENSIFWGNSSDGDGDQIYAESDVDLDIGHSVLQGGLDAIGLDAATLTDLGGNLDLDPFLVEMPTSGDGDWGTYADNDYGDLRIQAGSPAVDAADDDALPADTADLDEDGDTAEPLPIDLDAGPRAVSDAPDVGAYEVQDSPPASTGEIWYVTTTGDDADAGDSWSAALATLDEAVARAGPGDQVWVAAGTYSPEDVALQAGVALYGGFAGDEPPERDPNARDLEADETVLDGGGASVTGLLVDDGADLSTRVDGFTIRRYNSAGIRVTGGGVTIAHTTFTANTRTNGGGGIHVTDGHVHVVNSTFRANYGQPHGGGIYLTTTSTEAAAGTALVENSTFVGNRAASAGAAIYVTSAGALTVRNSTFTENHAETSGAEGGALAISTSSGRATILNSIFRGNTAVESGDQIWAESQTELEIGHSILEGGLAAVEGSPTELGGNLDADPAFVRAPSAGDGDWGTLGDNDYGDLRLQAASPAVDAGTNDGLPDDAADLDRDGVVFEPLPLDFDLMPRVVDGDGDDEGGEAETVDMGAYEREHGS